MLEPINGQSLQRTTRRILAVAALGALAACSNVQTFEYTAIDEIPPGPGLISGGDGVFVLYPLGGAGKGE